jgi:succinoglycan biosynthesis protein ExoA
MAQEFQQREWPLVSIVVPCRNEASFIERCLESVLGQDYPPEKMEILVVDGVSEDGTPQIVQKLIQHRHNAKQRVHRSGSASIVVLHNPNRTVPTALNLALQQAKGTIIFRLDGHSEMAHNYVRLCVAKLQERPDVACVGGPSVAISSGLVGAAYAMALQSAFGVGGSTFRTLRSEAFVDTLAFGGYRRELFSELGYFDPELHRNQDIMFSASLRKAGRLQLLIPGTHTLYHAPKNLRAIIQQNYNNGYWNTRVIHKMIGVLSWRHFVPLIFVCLLFGSLSAMPMGVWGRLSFLMISGSYLSVALLTSASLAFQHRRGSAYLLPLMFPIMHISYGVGSCVGLCSFLWNALSRISERRNLWS